MFQRKPAIPKFRLLLGQYLYALWSFNGLFLNAAYHLDITSMPYDPVCSVYVRAEVCKQNAIFNLFFRNTGHRSTQVIAGQLCLLTKADIGPER